MPPRQLWLFKFGCWATLGTALVFLVGHVVGVPGAGDPGGSGMADVAASYRYAFPGGSARTLMDLFRGFSLLFALGLVTIGGLGLALAKRCGHDVALMRTVARLCAVASLAMLLVSMMKFFIVPTLFIALMAVSFGVAAVRAPEA